MTPIATELARSGALSAADLFARVKGAFGSASTFHRVLKATPNVVTFGATSTRGYALRRNAQAPVPLYLCDVQGRSTFLGHLLALEANQWTLDTQGAAPRDVPTWVSFGQLGDALPVYQGLPWYMEAFRPAGFLGRAWVNEHAHVNGWPVDADTWSDDQVLKAALQSPWDWRGNISIGAFPHKPPELIPADQRLAVYAQRAVQVLNGEPAGSSADGEQPKFTAMLDEGHAQHAVLVKFSPRLAEGPAARRWADMLVTEAMAARTLALHGMSAASTEIFSHDDRVWLESKRFDRVGLHGRRGLASLRSLAESFAYRGAKNGWVGAVHHLQRHGVIDMDQYWATHRLADVCHLIHNVDMHMGNLSFLLPSTHDVPLLTVAPAYDMSPMRWSPSPRGQVPPLDTNEAIVRVNDTEAMSIAEEIWTTTAEHPLVSDEWRVLAIDRASKIRTMRRKAAPEPPATEVAQAFRP